MPASPVKYVLEVYRTSARSIVDATAAGTFAAQLGRFASDPSSAFGQPGDGVFLRAMALPYVQTYAPPRTEATSFEWTLGENPVIEHSGVREGMVRLTGRSGLRSRLGNDAQGGILFADGKRLFRELRDFLTDYQNTAAELEADGRATLVMVLRSLWEGDDFKVEPIAFEPMRNVQTSRFSWEYALTLRSYGKVNPRQPGFLGTAQRLARTASDAVDVASAYVAFAAEYVREVTRTGHAFLEPVRAVGRVMQQIEELSRAGQGLSRLPADAVEAALRVADDALSAARETVAVIAFADRAEHRDDFYDAAVAIGDARRSALEFFGQRMAPVPANGSAATMGTAAVGGRKERLAGELVSVYTVQQGDTLTLIANKLGVSAADLLELNGMSDHATLNDGSPLGPGAVLLVPAPDGVPKPSTQAVGLDDVFGVDVLQDPEGDWTLNSATDPDDVSLVRGRDLLKQALGNRMRTQQGEHAVFPGYGVPAILGDRALAETAGLLASRIRSQILRDPRIAKVVGVTVEDRGASFVAEAEAVPRIGAGIVLSVPVGV